MLNQNSDTSYIDITPLADILNGIKQQIAAIEIPEGREEVSVSNFDEVRLALRKELSEFATKLQKIVEATKPQFPKSFEISNLPKEREYPKEISVNNFNDIKSVLEDILRVISALNVTPTISVQAPEVNVTAPAPNLAPLLKSLDSLKYISDRADKPIAVRVSDGHKFVKALQQVEKATEKLSQSTDQLGVVYAGSSGINSDEFKTVIRNVDDVLGQYRVVDVDNDASPNYYGLMDNKGNWVILKETLSTGADTYRYSSGSNNYATNWTDRSSLTYGYFNTI